MKEEDLVMIRLPETINENITYYYNAWIRVKFIDNDGSFTGSIERKPLLLFSYTLREFLTMPEAAALRIFEEGQQFCYSDNVTVCECSGLCKDKC